MANITGISDYIVIDVETTGFSPEFDSIIQFSAIKISGGMITDSLSSYIHIDYPIPSMVSELTGITDAILKDAPTFSELETKIRNFIGDSIIVGHNISFDMRMLNSELTSPLENSTLDTVALARERIRLDSYKLESLCNALDVTAEKFHDALSDCKATFECFERLRLIPIFPMRDPEIISRYSNFGDIRARRADSCNPVEIDYPAYKGTFLGHDGTIYTTTLSSCTCPDYCERQKPCKHMYRLFGELRAIFNTRSKKLRAADFKSDDNCSTNWLKGKNVVITGSLSTPREEAFEKLSRHGAIVADNVTKKTDYLVIGENQTPSNKEKRAKEYIEKGIPIKIISEQELYSLMESKPKLFDIINPIIREIGLKPEFIKIRRSESASKPDDYSISFYGVLAMRLCERKKADSFIRVSSDSASEYVPESGLSYIEKGSDYLIYANETDASELQELIEHMISYCEDHAVCTFDVCSRYKECSDSMQCVNPDQVLAHECSYRRKLKNGIKFY